MHGGGRNIRMNFVAYTLVALLAGRVSTALAQSGPAGPVVFKNESGVKLTLTNFRYVDRLGQTRTLPVEWELRPGFYGYLTHGVGQSKIVAKKIMYDLVTADGKSEGWFCNSVALDGDGDFSSRITAENHARHLQDLGKTPVVTFKPAAARGPTEEQIASGVVKALGAAVLHQKASQVPDGIVESFAVELARKGRDELIKSAVDDLFPQMPMKDRATLGRLVPLALDDQLTDDNLRAAEAKDAIVDYLREKNPDFALASQAADFLYRVQQGAH